MCFSFKKFGAALALGIAFATQVQVAARAVDGNGLPANFPAFASEKFALARQICTNHNLQLPAAAREFFEAAQKGDWITTSNRFQVLEAANHTPEVPWAPPLYWGAIHDTYGVVELIRDWNPDCLREFGNEVVQSIPAGGIYFGGTEAGRFAVSLASESHTRGVPCFTLTQNALSDSSYLDYLSEMYGAKINLPDAVDVGRCSDEYAADAKQRLQHDDAHPLEPPQVRPGENVWLDGDKFQFSGPVSVMGIHALLIKRMMERNPKAKFYYEESYELAVLNPLLSPKGMVLEINQNPVGTFSPEIVRADHEYWTRKAGALLGPWLNTNTPVTEITNYVHRIFALKQVKDFSGDARVLRDPNARQAYAKCRCAIGGVYAWHAANAKTPVERQEMQDEAAFAFLQAFAICPSSPEVVLRCASQLIGQERFSDALKIIQAGRELAPENPSIKYVLKQLLHRTESESRQN